MSRHTIPKSQRNWGVTTRRLIAVFN